VKLSVEHLAGAVLLSKNELDQSRNFLHTLDFKRLQNNQEPSDDSKANSQQLHNSEH